MTKPPLNSAGTPLKYLIIVTLFLSIWMLSGCSGQIAAPDPSSDLSTPFETPLTEASAPALPPTLTAASVVTDPSLRSTDSTDPYSQINPYTKKSYNPDPALYNALFNTVERMEPSLDISQFDLDLFKKAQTCDSLYGPAGFQFYYLTRIKMSPDGQSVTFEYSDTNKEIIQNRETFYAKLNHLVYNVAPEYYTPIQKLFAIYDYITVHSDYTDSKDQSTYTPYSILMKGKGICGGFANLGHYVLNRVGIPTEYVSNEAHAWNIVQLDGKHYHTDITSGAGSFGSDHNLINTVLMDDKQRQLDLENMGIGDLPIILGYPSQDPTVPPTCTDQRFIAITTIFGSYSLDIDNNLIYYSDFEGIKSMALSGGAPQAVSSAGGYYLTFYHGTLYYVDENDFSLYKLVPGQFPELLDNTIDIGSLQQENGVLFYGSWENPIERRLVLNSITASDFDLDSSNHFPVFSNQREQTFRIDLAFSREMDITADLQNLIVLVNEAGDRLPLHMHWSPDGHTLSIRPKSYLGDYSAVSLLIFSGLTASDGQQTAECYDLTVNFDQ